MIFALEIVLIFAITLILRATGSQSLAVSDSALELLENGMLSSVMFFFVMLIYVVIKNRSFSALFPFEKVGAKNCSCSARSVSPYRL